MDVDGCGSTWPGMLLRWPSRRKSVITLAHSRQTMPFLTQTGALTYQSIGLSAAMKSRPTIDLAIADAPVPSAGRSDGSGHAPSSAASS